MAIFAGFLTGYLAGPVLAVNDEPLKENWAPGEWGADDKAGSVNRTTPAMVLEATKGQTWQGRYPGQSLCAGCTDFWVSVLPFSSIAEALVLAMDLFYLDPRSFLSRIAIGVLLTRLFPATFHVFRTPRTLSIGRLPVSLQQCSSLLRRVLEVLLSHLQNGLGVYVRFATKEKCYLSCRSGTFCLKIRAGADNQTETLGIGSQSRLLSARKISDYKF